VTSCDMKFIIKFHESPSTGSKRISGVLRTHRQTVNNKQGTRSVCSVLFLDLAIVNRMRSGVGQVH
jgi:hypothetical protein